MQKYQTLFRWANIRLYSLWYESQREREREKKRKHLYMHTLSVYTQTHTATVLDTNTNILTWLRTHTHTRKNIHTHTLLLGTHSSFNMQPFTCLYFIYISVINQTSITCTGKLKYMLYRPFTVSVQNSYLLWLMSLKG